MTSILATGALTTYAAARAELSVIGAAIVDDTHQNLVERIINAITDAVTAECGRSLHYASRVETYAPPRGERLILRATPVAATPAPTATLDGTAVAPTVEDAELGFLELDGGWCGESYERQAPGSVTLATLPGSAERVVTVTYSAGYVTQVQADASVAAHAVWALLSAEAKALTTEPEVLTRSLPWDIEQVVLQAVAMQWRLRSGGYATPAQLLTEEMCETLDEYERWVA